MEESRILEITARQIKPEKFEQADELERQELSKHETLITNRTYNLLSGVLTRLGIEIGSPSPGDGFERHARANISKDLTYFGGINIYDEPEDMGTTRTITRKYIVCESPVEESENDNFPELSGNVRLMKRISVGALDLDFRERGYQPKRDQYHYSTTNIEVMTQLFLSPLNADGQSELESGEVRDVFRNLNPQVERLNNDGIIVFHANKHDQDIITHTYAQIYPVCHAGRGELLDSIDRSLSYVEEPLLIPLNNIRLHTCKI